MNATRPFWLLTRLRARRPNVFIAHLPGGRRALPVFSFEDEARMFLDLGVGPDGWRTRETPAEELVAMLLGDGADIGTVLLDPLPGVDHLAMELFGTSRDAFVERQLRSADRPDAPRDDQGGGKTDDASTEDDGAPTPASPKVFARRDFGTSRPAAALSVVSPARSGP